MLRDSPKNPEDNGVWLVFSETAKLADPGIRRDFPSIRLIGLLGGKIGALATPPADNLTFETEALQLASFSSSTTAASAEFHSLGRVGLDGYAATDNRTIHVAGEQPHFSPTIRFPLRSKDLRRQPAPVKLLKLRCKSNLGAEGRGTAISIHAYWRDDPTLMAFLASLLIR